MLSLQSNTAWSGSLRVTIYLLLFIVLTSITEFGLSVASAAQTYSAPIDDSLWSYTLDYRWSIGWHVAYFTTAPFISMIHSVLDLSVYFFGRLSPTYAILASVVMAIGWTMQLVFWFQCDFVPDFGQCQQFYLVHADRSSLSGAIVGVSTNVTGARIALGFLLLTLYAVYTTCATIALYRKKISRRHENESSEQTESLHCRQKSSGTVSAAVFYA